MPRAVMPFGQYWIRAGMVLALLLAPFARATSLRQMDTLELTLDSQDIVIGDVQEVLAPATVRRERGSVGRGCRAEASAPPRLRGRSPNSPPVWEAL